MPAIVSKEMYEKVKVITSTDLGIAAIVSYFNSKGYILAAELLIHMKDNSVLGSTYHPHYGDLVRMSSETTKIIKSTLIKSSGRFEKNTGNADLYFAIHLFDWIKTKRVLTITDY